MTSVSAEHRRRVMVITGSRAEYGLLRSVMMAIRDHQQLELRTIVCGAHLLPPAFTVNDVASDFHIHARIEMQIAGQCTHAHDAAATGRGITAIAKVLADDVPEFVVVLGDRIEAFAASVAAAISGIRVAHMHGGDRAEGIADDALRHAISKLAHLHLAATDISANRLIAMGEDPSRVVVVGSPAIDSLEHIHALADDEYAELGSPRIVVLLHPSGDESEIEHHRARRLLEIVHRHARTLVLHPNHDPGRDGIMDAIKSCQCPSVSHLPREKFVGLLRRADVLIGNSSAGLIETAAIPTWSINIGTRQAGRERSSNVVDVEDWDYQTIDDAIDRCLRRRCENVHHPFGDGRTGMRVAEMLAAIDMVNIPLRKRNTY